MAISRYRNLNTINDGSAFFETSDFPDLSKIRTFSLRTTEEDRLDSLAFRHLGKGEYWWVLAAINNLEWAWDFEPGDILKIPIDVQDVFRLF